ncbi:amino acid permease [Alicyclobacillus kakegawensis]|uniref:amino acid permease n=1 Tax=Alicyclobacillus kakegawensis TaxID=392012 RepID=UPI000834C95F|nr:amino acid permease [Alicyclobacillus kakegawensis]
MATDAHPSAPVRGAENPFEAREQGLRRGLGTGQLSMIALGSAIGTGLFLGSGSAIGSAGPSIIVSYLIGACVIFVLMGCLAEMSVAHPTAGSFGVFAEQYLHPWAGFIIRYSYWAANAVAVGGEVTAVSIYMKYWFPDSPGLLWICLFGALLLAANAYSVRLFGVFEFWFSMIKVAAIILFILVGAYVVFVLGEPGTGPANYVNHGGFFPHGAWGTWVGGFVALFSFIGFEVVAITAGEAKDPERAVPKAFRWTVVRLVLFYVLAIAIMLMVVPWQQAGTDESPFVKVMEILRIPGAAGVMNFVVLTAALSAMNAQLYATTRMMFSLARGGYAPKLFGRLTRRGVPAASLAVSAFGVVLAALLTLNTSSVAYTILMGLALFGALITWFIILLTHLSFRRAWARQGRRRLPIRMAGYPYLPVLGLLMLLAVFVSMWFTGPFRGAIVFGVLWLVLLSFLYGLWHLVNGPQSGLQTGSPHSDSPSSDA